MLVIGLHDGQVEGTWLRVDRVNEWRQASIDFCMPPVRTHISERPCRNDAGGTDNLLVIEVEPSEHVHANRRDEVYLRVGDETRRLTTSQAQELLYDKGQAFFESTPIDAAADELDEPLLAPVERLSILIVGRNPLTDWGLGLLSTLLESLSYSGATSSAGWATRTSAPISRRPARIWMAQPGLATTTIGAPVAAIASAFWRRSRPAISGCSTL